MTRDDIDEAAPCIRGCIRKGTDEPLPARHGPYCNRCFYQYVRALDIAAELVEHVTSLITYQARLDDDKVSTSGDAPVPFNLDAFHDANETFRRLAYWASVWAGYLGTTPPSTQGRVWRNSAGKIMGFRRGIPAEHARRQTAHVARWLTDRLDMILQLATDRHAITEDIDAWRDDLKDVYRINARWPRDPKPRYSDVPCPDDGARLAIYPPLEFGDDERIVCEKCGRHFPVENYEFYVRLFREAQIERERTARTAQHLFRKYLQPSGGGDAA